jgi:hypothetical protein
LVFSLREFNAPVENDLGNVHRWQCIIVERDGNLFEFPRSLGLASEFDGIDDILIVSLFEDEVDMVMDTADSMRTENQIILELSEGKESTLVQDFLEQKDELRLTLLNKSTIGATGKMHQRTGFIPRR